MRCRARSLVTLAAIPLLALSACGDRNGPDPAGQGHDGGTRSRATATGTPRGNRTTGPSSAGTTRPVVWAAVGDSYASGTGTGRYDLDGPCMRSTSAYPALLAAHRDVDLRFLACAGATTKDVLTDQVPRIPRDAALVTVSAGGNDAGFFGVVPVCLTDDGERECLARLARMRRGTDRTVGPGVDRLLQAITRRAPDATVVLVDYPHPFSDGRACAAARGVSGAEARALDDTVAALDRVLARRAEAAGVQHVATAPRFDGHGLCARSPWVNGLTPGWTEMYHPSVAGHRSGFAPLVTPLLRQAAPSPAR